ncbi:PilW family protein [Herbaspirillum seropedicae]|uniref:PilW family protein n=1 Tax=Herbaspirillum seropedicae TaxID=964 RepID=UPI003F8D760D
MRAPSLPRRQAGLTLVELMVALAVGLLVVLAAGVLLQQARESYEDIDDASRVNETGRLVLDHLQQALRQAGHLPWEDIRQSPALAAGLRGVDDSRQAELHDPAAGQFGGSTGDGLHHSDLLMLGLFGAAPASRAQVGNCSGAPAPTGPLEESARHWMIYYIAAGSSGEPELRCRYQGRHGVWTSDAIARGVEAMQLRYAIDSDSDGAPDQWRDASDMSAAQWSQVVLVQIALLVRGERQRPRDVASPRRYELLAAPPPTPPGWTVDAAPGEERRRAVFRATVLLRNLRSPGAGP